jgi:hypothetical protein
MAANLLQFPNVMAKQYVCDFMSNIAVGAPALVEWVVNEYRPASGQVERRRGKRAGLKAVEFDKLSTVD